jgi:ring-1,2-phenylacetyl-CoA epoxidase subunit PaaC
VIIDPLARADDALVLGHRLSEWCGLAPSMEEDVALANLALDLIGQARALYQLAGEAAGKTEDEYAYCRDARAFRNLLITEQENGDFAHTILRHLLYAGFAEFYWQTATREAEPALAALGARFAKELAYHWRHAADWTLRLGDGTAESHQRAQAALDRLWPYTGEMFAGEDAAALHGAWRARLDPVLAEATLSIPDGMFMQKGGRRGLHTESFGRMLAEMQSLARAHPGAAW